MRALLLVALLLTPLPALADECGDLIDRIVGETAATQADRRSDYANFTAGDGTTLTLSCAAPQLSSVGAQFRGETPPDAYYALFGKAGHAVTGIDAGVIEAAAHTAREAASRLRHSNVDAGGARVTCSVSRSETGALTMCAVIEHSDRS
ncbi:ABC transporter ATPase [uncultured Methylobacterium sp.]|uniref:ABC transporter ATPase n=1 Tax=uncultured Methylobacterium sp. TaxID=157278 RepID=UPI0035CC807D